MAVSSSRRSFEDLVERGRTTVVFLREIAERVPVLDSYPELATECRRLAEILESAVEAIASVLPIEEEQ